MTAFNKIYETFWNYSAHTIFPEQVFNHLFLVNGNGYEWVNGEICNCFERQLDRKQPESLADLAIRQSHHDKFKDDPVDFHEASYWFDKFSESRKQTLQHQKRYVPSHLTDGYDLLTKIPDNITEEWASAVLYVCDWLDAITEDIVIEQKKENQISFYISSFYDKCREEVFEENPYLKRAYDDHKKECEGLIALSAKSDWQETHKCITHLVREKVEPLAIESLKKFYADIVKYRTEARQRIKELHPQATALVPPELPRDTSQPDWYVPNEERAQEQVFPISERYKTS